MKKIICAFAALLCVPSVASACSGAYSVILETFGQGVLVELREGEPGSSTMISSRNSYGGRVHFSGLCAGHYFLAIGDNNTVSVTPVHVLEDGEHISSTITVTRSQGNVSRRSRGSL
jgi:hypothetical protein